MGRGPRGFARGKPFELPENDIVNLTDNAELNVEYQAAALCYSQLGAGSTPPTLAPPLSLDRGLADEAGADAAPELAQPALHDVLPEGVQHETD